MGRISVVLASLLKPVDDTRMYEKLGLSLGQTNKYEVNIIGFSTKKIKNNSSINFFPIFGFHRLSLFRVFAPIKYFRTLLKLKPDIIIVNSHDLLIVTLLYSIIYGSKFVYDVQENYLRNIIHNSSLSFVFRYPFAWFVRLKERVIHPFTDHYIVAEESYPEEMPWLKKKSTLVLNKYKDLQEFPEVRQRKPLQLLYSGTISKTYGILECINLAQSLYAIEPDIRLKIIGHCPDRRLLDHIRKIADKQKFINFDGSDYPVPHSEIIAAIRESSFGLIFYHLNKAIKDCFPTKIYEYLANRLPVIIQNYPPWTKIITENHAGIILTMQDQPEDLMARIRKAVFYKRPISKSIYWPTEEEKFLKAMDNLLVQD